MFNQISEKKLYFYYKSKQYPMGNKCCNMEDDETQDIDARGRKPISAATKESFMTDGTSRDTYMRGPR